MWIPNLSTLIFTLTSLVVTAMTTKTDGHSSGVLPCEEAADVSTTKAGHSSNTHPLTPEDLCHPPHPMNWSDAHEYCRGVGGFLWSKEDLSKTKYHSVIRSDNKRITNHAWTALNNHNGYFHWLTQYPESGKFLSWSGVPPEPWDRRCGALTLISSNEESERDNSSVFTLMPCQEELPFLCHKVDDAQDLEVSDIDLVVSSNMQHLEQHSWLEVPHDNISTPRFTQLKLNCNAIKRSTGEPLHPQPHVFWRKDGVIVYNRGTAFYPATIHDPTKRLFLRHSEAAATTRQGTYTCEMWRPKSIERIQSNNILITLKEWITLILDIEKLDDNMTDVESETEEIQKALSQYITVINDSPFAPIHVEKVNRSTKIYVKYKFLAHIKEKYLFNYDIEQVIERFTKQLGNLSREQNYTSSSFSFPTYCMKHEDNWKYGNTIEWDISKVGEIYPKNFRCESSDNKLIPAGMCHWNFTHGAHQILDTNKCSRFDQCPRGYTGVANHYCVDITKESSWDKGYKLQKRIGLENSIMDMQYNGNHDLIKSLSLIMNNRNMTKSIWLPVRRRRLYSSLEFLKNSNEGINLDFLPLNISWAEKQPNILENCLALNLETKQAYTDNCDIAKPFLSLVNLNEISESMPILEERRENRNWTCVTFASRSKMCFTKFRTELTWSEAQEFCSDYNASLPTPSVGFMDWVYRRYINENNIDSVWVAISTKQNLKGLYFESGTVDKINWQADTNYSLKYASLNQNGWKLEEESSKKTDIICQQRLTSNYDISIRLRKSSDAAENKLCIHAESKETNEKSETLNELLNISYLKCFRNGIQQLVENGTGECPYSIELKGQGYYRCQTWSGPPYTLVESNEYLYRDMLKTTFAINISCPYTNFFKVFNDSNLKKYITQIQEELKNTEIGNWKINVYDMFNVSYEKQPDLYSQIHIELFSGDAHNSTLENKIKDIIENSAKRIQNNECNMIEIRSTHSCPRETFAMNNVNHTWPQTNKPISLPEDLCITDKGEPVTRDCLGDFLQGYFWDDSYLSCNGTPSESTKKLWEISKGLGTFTDTGSWSLANLTSNTSSLQLIDIHLVATTFQSVASHQIDRNFTLDELVQTMDNIMSSNIDSFNMTKLNSSGTLLDSFEKLTFAVPFSNAPQVGDQKLVSSFSLISVNKLNLDRDSPIVGFYSKSDGAGETLIRGEFTEKLDKLDANAAIILPDNLTRNIEFEQNMVQLTFAAYKNSKLFKDESLSNYKVNSYVIQAKYNSEKEVKNLPKNESVRILFKPNENSNDTKCVFWDFSRNSGKGGWSTEGCIGLGKIGKYDVCECNHLTCFAQLINFNSTPIISGMHKSVLDIITIIGCCLSIIGLLLVFTTFFLFKKWRRSLSNKILLNLSIAVFSSMVIFLGGIDQIWDDILCRGISVALHYFILATFGWMLVEAVHQYLKFVKVVGTYIPRFLWKASICAWGLPLLPILAVLVYDSHLYDYDYDDEYNGNKICWMSSQAFNYTFLPPLIATMFINAVMFCLIIYSAIYGRAQVNSTMSERSLFINQLNMAICIFFLLGFTWIFGLLTILVPHIIFSYLFCIFNTLQGFFIFVFYICRGRSARRLWHDFLSVLTKDTSSSSPANTICGNNSRQLHNDSITFEKGNGILVLPRKPMQQFPPNAERSKLLSSGSIRSSIQGLSHISYKP